MIKSGDVSSLITEKNLTMKVYMGIREMMLNYEIVPGQRLVFADLAKELGVSRTPVNNALLMLAREGLLDLVPGQGYSIHKITRDEAEKLYDIIRILSLGAVEKVISGLTPERLLELERRKDNYEKAVIDRVGRGRFLLDQEFHAYLMEVSGNEYLADCLRGTYQRIFLRHYIESLRRDRAQQVIKEHNDIFEAVRKKDVALTRQAIEYHLDAGKDYVLHDIFGPKQP